MAEGEKPAERHRLAAEGYRHAPMSARVRPTARSGRAAPAREDAARIEARLETAVWGAGIGLWEIDFELDRTVWFSDWCDRLGLDPCDGPSHISRWDAYVHEDDLEEASQRFRDHIAGKEDYYDAEYRIRDRSGRWRWLFERGRVVERAADGRAVRMVGVCMDIDARKEAELDLIKSRRRLELALESARGSLEREIIEIANREQHRIGNDLHDGLGQDLTGIALMLRGIGLQLRREGSAVCVDVEQVIGLVNVAIENTRALARGLSPVSAERDGLAAALQALAARATDRYGVPVAFEARVDRPVLFDDTAATHLYRIAQEALTNAMRHSHATSVTIRLSASGSEVRLEVEDDGRGIGDACLERSEGLGMRIMRYRAQVLGGDLSLEPGARGGAIVRCCCPLQP